MKINSIFFFWLEIIGKKSNWTSISCSEIKFSEMPVIFILIHSAKQHLIYKSLHIFTFYLFIQAFNLVQIKYSIILSNSELETDCKTILCKVYFHCHLVSKLYDSKKLIILNFVLKMFHNSQIVSILQHMDIIGLYYSQSQFLIGPT